MNPISLWKRMDWLKRQGLTEHEIAVRCKVRQWTVSRILKLGGLHESLRTLVEVFELAGNVTLSALLELASWPSEDQRLALPDVWRLFKKRRSVRRRDVAMVMARRSRNLDRAPFPTGSCAACAKRSGTQADLFGNVGPDDLGRCRDAACFARKANAVAARRARWTGRTSGNNAQGKNRKGRT